MAEKIIPSNYNVYFQTYGCTLNVSDTETMQGLVSKEGYNVVDTIDEADIAIINTCTVKHATFNRFKSLLMANRSKDIKLVITGCIPQTNLDLMNNVSAIGVEQLDEIVRVVSETLSGNIIHLIDRKNGKRLNLPKIRRNEIIEIVPISKGCLGNCAYCKVRFARGALVSYPLREIVEQVKTSISEGVKEVWLTSQDNGAYGLDINIDIITLLDELINLKGDFKIRFGMSNPNFVYDRLDDFIRIFRSNKMYKFLHLPIQAGDDTVLKDMRRKYTSEEFKKVYSEFKSNFDDFVIGTDIICGYPTESDEQFDVTLDIVKELNFDVVNISKFSSMDQTDASKLKQLASEVIKTRSKKLSELHKEISFNINHDLVGKTFNVLIDETNKDGSFVGRTDSYRTVTISKENNSNFEDFDKIKLGDYLSVEIVDHGTYDLRGKIIF